MSVSVCVVCDDGLGVGNTRKTSGRGGGGVEQHVSGSHHMLESVAAEL